MAGDNSAFSRELRMGMVGGGPGAFIGEVHRKAARMDGGIRLVAGAFSSDPEKSRQTGREQYLDPRRVYGSVSEMVRGERSLPPGERIDFVSIVTPNHLHFPVARDFLRAGFHVVCDKPMTLNLREALALREIVRKSKKVFALTHNYTGLSDGQARARHGAAGRPGARAQDHRPVPAGLADSAAGAARLEAGGMADRPEALRRRRLHGRPRHARGEPRRVRHRPAHPRNLRRPDDLRPGPQDPR